MQTQLKLQKNSFGMITLNLVTMKLWIWGILSEIVACLACPECKHVGIELLHEKRFGLATKCKMLCGNCTYEKNIGVLTKS